MLRRSAFLQRLTRRLGVTRPDPPAPLRNAGISVAVQAPWANVRSRGQRAFVVHAVSFESLEQVEPIAFVGPERVDARSVRLGSRAGRTPDAVCRSAGSYALAPCRARGGARGPCSHRRCCRPGTTRFFSDCSTTRSDPRRHECGAKGRGSRTCSPVGWGRRPVRVPRPRRPRSTPHVSSRRPCGSASVARLGTAMAPASWARAISDRPLDQGARR